MQNGSLIETKRRIGQTVWEFRWRDRTSGKAVYRRIVVGSMEQFKTEADAREIVGGIVLEINSDDPRLRSYVLTMSQLIGIIANESSLPTTHESPTRPRWAMRII